MFSLPMIFTVALVRQIGSQQALFTGIDNCKRRFVIFINPTQIKAINGAHRKSRDISNISELQAFLLSLENI